MRTEELVAVLGRDAGPIGRYRLVRSMGAALAVAAAAAVGLVFVVLGMRPDLLTSAALTAFLTRIALGLAVLMPATFFLVRVARPGGERSVKISILVLPFVILAIAAAVVLAQQPTSHWHNQIFGENWMECLLFIPLNAIVPFAAVTWGVRQAAPTNLILAGAVSGLAAGTISAVGYSFHCLDNAVPFTAVWYAATIGLCTAIGAKCGPLFLRW